MNTNNTTFEAFSEIPEVTPIAKGNDKESMSRRDCWLKKQLKKERKALQRIQELLEQQELKRQEAELAAAAKAAKKAERKAKKKNKKQDKQNLFWDKVSSAIVKAIPALLTTALGMIAKSLFQRKLVIA